METVYTFENLKETFRTETALDWKSHIDTYIQYVQAKQMELSNQHLSEIRQQIAHIPLNTI